MSGVNSAAVSKECVKKTFLYLSIDGQIDIKKYKDRMKEQKMKAKPVPGKPAVLFTSVVKGPETTAAGI